MVDVQIPDNVEITLLSINTINGQAVARIRIRKNIEGDWWTEELGLIKVGDRIGKGRRWPKNDAGTKADRPVDMTTKYQLLEIEETLVPRLVTRTFYKYEFKENGETTQDWATDLESLRKAHPAASDVGQPLPDPNGTGFWKKEEKVPMIDSSTGETSMVKRWKIRVENTEARPGQKKEYWFEEADD